MQDSYDHATTLCPLRHWPVNNICFLNRPHNCTHRHCSNDLKLIHPHFLFGHEGIFEIACDFVCGRNMSESIESTSDRVFEPGAMFYLSNYSLLRCGMNNRTRLDSDRMSPNKANKPFVWHSPAVECSHHDTFLNESQPGSNPMNYAFYFRWCLNYSRWMYVSSSLWVAMTPMKVVIVIKKIYVSCKRAS